MANVIFIRGLREEEEEILNAFKEKHSIPASTKAVQNIIVEYSRLNKRESILNQNIRDLQNQNFDLAQELEEYRKYFALQKKLLASDL